jgi:hypothetical protein
VEKGTQKEWWSESQRQLGSMIPLHVQDSSKGMSKGGFKMVYEKMYQEELKRKSLKGLPVWGKGLGTLPFKRTLKMGETMGLTVQMPTESSKDLFSYLSPAQPSHQLNSILLAYPDHSSKKEMIRRKAELQKFEKEWETEKRCQKVFLGKKDQDQEDLFQKTKEKIGTFLRTDKEAEFGMDGQKPYVVRYLKEKEKGFYRGQSSYDHLKKQNATVLVSKEWEGKLNQYGHHLFKALFKPEILNQEGLRLEKEWKAFDFLGLNSKRGQESALFSKENLKKKEKRRGLDWNERTGHLVYHAAPLFQYNAMEKFYQLDKHALKTEDYLKKNRPQTLLDFYGERGRSSNFFKGWKPTWLFSRPSSKV